MITVYHPGGWFFYFQNTNLGGLQMKKLFSLVFVLVFAVVLTACTSNDYATKIEDLQQEIETLEQTLEATESNVLALESTLAALEGDMSVLEEQLNTLEANQYDGTIVFTLDNENNTNTVEVHFTESEEKTVFELLTETFDVDYDESDFGVFLNGIEQMHTSYGNFISIEKNDVSLTTGIDQATYEDGDHFTFTKSWWDEDAKTLNDSLQLFLTNHKDAFISESDYFVLTGLYHLDPVTGEAETPLESANDLIKQIIALRSQGVDVTSHQEALNDGLEMGHLYTASLAVLALYDYEHFDASLYLEMINIGAVESASLDTLSLMTLALNALDFEDQSIMDEIVNRLSSGDYNHPYGQNSVTYANIITALVALDINPYEVNDDNVNLVDQLLSYQTATGSFMYTNAEDLMFSTPQSFLALTALELYLNDGQTNVFLID